MTRIAAAIRLLLKARDTRMLAIFILVAWMLSSLIELALLLGVAYFGVILFHLIRSTRFPQTDA